MLRIKNDEIQKNDVIHFFYAGNGEWIYGNVIQSERNYIRLFNTDKNEYRSYSRSKIQSVEILNNPINV
jgi:hypothetical protein